MLTSRPSRAYRHVLPPAATAMRILRSLSAAHAQGLPRQPEDSTRNPETLALVYAGLPREATLTHERIPDAL